MLIENAQMKDIDINSLVEIEKAYSSVKGIDVMVSKLKNVHRSRIRKQWKKKGYERRLLSVKLYVDPAEEKKVIERAGEKLIIQPYYLIGTYKTAYSENTYRFAEKRELAIRVLGEGKRTPTVELYEVFNDFIVGAVGEYRPTPYETANYFSYGIVSGSTIYDLPYVRITRSQSAPPSMSEIDIFEREGSVYVAFIDKPVRIGTYTTRFSGEKLVINVGGKFNLVLTSPYKMFKGVITAFRGKKPFEIENPIVVEVPDQDVSGGAEVLMRGLKTAFELVAYLNGKFKVKRGRVAIGELYADNSGKILAFPYRASITERETGRYVRSIDFIVAYAKNVKKFAVELSRAKVAE